MAMTNETETKTTFAEILAAAAEKLLVRSDAACYRLQRSNNRQTNDDYDKANANIVRFADRYGWQVVRQAHKASGFGPSHLAWC